MLQKNHFLTLLASMIVCIALLLATVVAIEALAVSPIVGPVYPSPGGVDVSATGIIGGPSGMNIVYTNFDFNQFDALYWGPWDASAVQLALDDAVDAPLETLSFDAAQSDLPNGVARWSGQAELTHYVAGVPVTVTVDTRITMRPTDLGGPLAMELASSLSITGSGAVLPVTNDYQVNLLAEILWASVWQPANVVFDGLETVPSHHVIVNLSGGFFYTDQAIADLTATNDGPTELDTATALSATVSAGTHISYTWDFGDSSSGSGITTTHTYAAPGVYTATVEAANSASTIMATTIVYVDEPISGLAASNNGPTLLGNATTLTATVGVGSNVTFAWDCGDGHLDSGATTNHVYAVAGTYTATVTASNAVSSVTTTTIVVVEAPVYPAYMPLVRRGAP